MMNLLQINERLCQRPPFQMVERVTEFEENRFAVGVKCVSVNEPYFAGHFPGVPIMPGVLLIESAAQLCSLVMTPQEGEEKRLYVLLRVKDFKFLRPVIPGDRLMIRVEVVRAAALSAEFSAVLTVDGEVRAKGNLLFTSMAQEQIYGDS